MPPKKFKTVSPVVVGTVSTRSTRRQSVVNIEIPKLKPKSVRKGSTANYFLKDSDSSIQLLDTLEPAELSEKIKATYSGRAPKGKLNEFGGAKIELEGLEPKKAAPSSKSSPVLRNVSSAKQKQKLSSNNALLQILEDWTDDESEDKRDTPSLDSSDETDYYRNKEFENLEFGAEDISKIIGDYYTVSKPSVSSSLQEEDSTKSEVIRDIERTLTSEADDSSNESPTMAKNTIVEIDEEVSESEIPQPSKSIQEVEMSLETPEVGEDCIIADSQGYEDEVVVECITEEIIPDGNEELVVVENSEETTIVSPCHNHDSVNEYEIQLASEDIKETSQSLSTTDSNDSEVRRYFSNAVESNAGVDEDQFSRVDQESRFDELFTEQDVIMTSVQERTEDVSGIQIDDHCKKMEVVEENSAVIVEDKDLQSDILEGCTYLEQTEGMSQEEITKTRSSDDARMIEEESMEKDIQTVEEVKVTREEQSLEGASISQVVNETTLIIKDNNASETIGDDLEQKVAKMNLGHKIVPVNIADKVAELNLNVPPQEDLKHVEDIDVKSDKLRESVDSPKKSERIIERPRRTKSAEPQRSKETKPKLTKTPKTIKSVNERKPPKSKDVKPKEKRMGTKSIKETNLQKKPAYISSYANISQSRKTKPVSETKADESLWKKEKPSKNESIKEKSEMDSEDIEVRRSSRIKSISVLKKKTTGHGLVRSKSEPCLADAEVSDSSSAQTESERGTPIASPVIARRERKTRWSNANDPVENVPTDFIVNQEMRLVIDEKPKMMAKDPVVEARLKQFVHLKENLYKTDRMACKEAKKMTCDCFLTAEEIEAKEYGCGEDCLNRLLLIECGNLCQVGDRCTNKRFQKNQFAPLEVFNTDKKGLGLRAAANIPYGEFILEYVGEVLDSGEFDKRAEVYSQDKNIHYYFMALRADAIIDATIKGNISRFINHSCDPNAETQKWTVNGELRIGFFSTRTILAGEEVTFDYRFQRYGKEAQKCYCGAAICRGWLGEQPDSDDEDEDEEEEEEIAEPLPEFAQLKIEIRPLLDMKSEVEKIEEKPSLLNEESQVKVIKDEVQPVGEAIPAAVLTPEVRPRRKVQKKKPRIELFEEIDQLNEEIEMLVTTGLKNQAHTLKLSRLMVRAKEPQQRAKLLRVLRKGELPCRRLFLDYHGLRLMHGYMIDAQHLAVSNKKFESLRLEMLQTLAVLPIPNKTMLKDSKVLPTVEKWATDKDLSSPGDSDSNSPKTDQDSLETPKKEVKTETVEQCKREDGTVERSIEDQEEEIKFLASKLLEEWKNLKDVFRIPKKERIEQMKEHEREANKKFMQSSYSMEPDKDRKSERYRGSFKYKEREPNKKAPKPGEKYSAEFIKLSRIERRKLFALQHELKEEERRLKQREMWRQHEMNCLMIGSDPRFTAPFDPSKPYQCIWNPQIGQWQNYPLPQNSPLLGSQPSMPNLSMPLPGLNLPSHHIPKSIPYQFTPPMSIGTSVPQIQPIQSSMPPLQVMPNVLTQTMASHAQKQPQLPTSLPQISTLSTVTVLHGALQQAVQIPQQNIPPSAIPLPSYPEPKPKEEEDLLQVKFMGPIPPPAKLPPKWKCAKDKYGRPYYYHIKIRKSQWEPPPYVEPAAEDPEETSESDTSSGTFSDTSESSSENSDSEEEIDDTKLLLEVRKQMDKPTKLSIKPVIPEPVKLEEQIIFPSPSPEDKTSEDYDLEVSPDISIATTSFLDEEVERPSIDIRLKEQFNLSYDRDKPPKKKRRIGLCEEIIIPPRTEADIIQSKEDLKRYKANKERVKKQKELALVQAKKVREIELKKPKEKNLRMSLKVKIKEMPEFNSEAAKKIKENFRANMASTVVTSLNVYRKSDCKEGRITNTDDFKHLARKLTHFVMLKEMKHIARIEDLTCTDNVKMKAREYIRKYMSKFGEMYIKRNDSPDFKD